MIKPCVVVDFNNQDVKRRLRLDCFGTLRDLERQNIQMTNGLALTLYMDDEDEEGRPQQLVVDGVVEYSDEDQCWAAVIDWDAIQYVPVGKAEEANSADGAAVPAVPSSPPRT